MNERSIWRLAFRDIVAVEPLRILHDRIPSMALQDIRTTALRAAHLDSLFDNDSVSPKNVEWKALRTDTLSMDICAGGKFMFILREDGSLHLHHTHDLQESVLSVSRPENATPRLALAGRSCLLLSSFCGHHVAVTYECFHDEAYVRHYALHPIAAH